MTFPLAGVRVVSLEQAVGGPLCTRHLADLGADVIKIERPGEGDLARYYDSVVHGESAYFVWLNRGKRSAALDLKTETDRATLDDLLDTTDVLVSNLGPGAADRLGLGWTSVHERWPRLVTCAISGYGADGPYRDRKAFDLLIQGESGLLEVQGTADAPVKSTIPIADVAAGVYALSSILAALYERERSGLGRFIDISMLDCVAEWMVVPAYYQRYTGQPPARSGARHNTLVPYGPYRVADGLAVNLAIQTEAQWDRLCRQVLERPDLAEDSRYRTSELRVRNRSVLEPLIESLLANQTRTNVEARLQAADVPFGSLNTVADLLNHAQLEARNRWFSVDTPSGPALALEHPLNIAGLPRQLGPVPALGASTEELRRSVSGKEPAEDRSAASEAPTS